MEEEALKGTVTSLSSMFAAEDAKKAAKRVHDTIVQKQEEMNHLREFVADNTNLINLVQKLPEDLHHDIMVPFGKAAFFPGRLIHTNEFLVLLGEGYYTERTSKQTIEILKRRGKALESQVDSLKAMMQDLKAEALFFDATASEAAEGLVEIREDYVEENSIESASESGLLKEDSPSFSEADNSKVAVEDEEYARMMSRLDELEKEELAAESDNESDEDEQTKDNLDQLSDHNSLDQNLRYTEKSQSRKLPKQTKVENTITEELSNKYHHQRDFTDPLNSTGLMVPPVPKDDMLHGKSLAHNMSKSNPAEKALILTEVKEKVDAMPSSRNEVSGQTSKPAFDGHQIYCHHYCPCHMGDTNIKSTFTHYHMIPSFEQAFTGSVVERAHNLQTNSREQTVTTSQSSTSQPSKPVSRFKMQRR